MLKLKLKTILVLILITTSHAVFAQVLGGLRANSQGSPREVSPSKITDGPYDGSVNLFTGSYSSSYSLGKVATVSGLSFNLNLVYSPNTVITDNFSVASGILYGEGWIPDIPRITINTEVQNLISTTNPENTGFTAATAANNGRLVWMSPHVYIPGVINEEFILKPTPGNNSVFIPSKFNEYIEAHLDGERWRVVLSNGTVYEFSHAKSNVRNATNLRLPESMLSAVGTDAVATKALASSLLPKTEVLEWYCSSISNPNHAGNQQIVFKYNTFGKFNFFNEMNSDYQHNLLIHLIGSSLGARYRCTDMIPETDPRYACGFVDRVIPSFDVYRDIVLTDVYALYENTTIEQLELTYQTWEDPNMQNMLLRSQAGVSPKLKENGLVDELYNQKVVYSFGFGSQNTFSDWLRYHHPYSSDILKNNPTANRSIDPLNPYSFNSDKRLITKESTYPYKSQSEKSMAFNHCYLESPRLNIKDASNNLLLATGDLYEIKTYIQTPVHIGINSSSYTSQCNFDINISTGSLLNKNGNNTYQTIRNNLVSSYQEVNTYESNMSPTYKSEEVFSTFNNAIKWTASRDRENINTVKDDNGASYIVPGQTTAVQAKVTSNYFVMPNIPIEYGGLTFEIGAANSDHNFAQTATISITRKEHLDGRTANRLYSDLQLPPTQMPSSYIRHNFGIGMPWRITKGIYDRLNAGSLNYLDDSLPGNGIVERNYGSRWHVTSPINDFVFSVPTLTGQNYTLDAFPELANTNATLNINSLNNATKGTLHPYSLLRMELIRYGKNPYMLKEVKVYKISTTEKQVYEADVIQQGMSLVSKYVFDYTVAHSAVSNNLNSEKMTSLSRAPFSSELTPILYNRNIILLKSIKEVPTNCSPCTYNLAQVPTTQFEYTKIDKNGSFHSSLQKSNLNYEFFVMNRITNPFGGITQIEYDASQAWINKLNKEAFLYFHTTNSGNNSLYIKGNSEAIEIKGTKVVAISKYSEKDASTNASFVQKKEYLYNQPSFFQKNIFTPTSFLTQEQEAKTFWGYGQVTVREPQSVAGRPTTTAVYTFESTDNHLFGKTLSIWHYSENQVIKKETHHYAKLKAFDRSYELFNENEYHMYMWESQTLPPNGLFWLGKAQLTFNYRFHNQQQLLFEKYDDWFCNSYFIKETQFKEEIIDPTTQKTITNFTDFDYWDCDYTGNTNSRGFPILAQAYNFEFGNGGNGRLKAIPSFKIFSVKKHSLNAPSEYIEEQSLYYYDLIGNIGIMATDNLPVFTNIYTRKLRDLVYQKRKIGKTAKLPAVVNSDFYLYHDRWNSQSDPEDDLSFNAIVTENLTEQQCSAYVTPPILPPNIPNPGGRFTPLKGGYNDAFKIIKPILYGYVGIRTDELGSYNNVPYLPYDEPSAMSVIPTLTGRVMLLQHKKDIDNNTDIDKILKFSFGTSVYPDSKWITIETFQGRNYLGWPTAVVNQSGMLTRYTYAKPQITHYYCPNLNKYVKSGTSFPHPGMPIKLTLGIASSPNQTANQIITYNNQQEISSIEDENGKKVSYIYDEHNRLKETHFAEKNGAPLLINKQEYSTWKNNNSDDFNQRVQQNYVKTTTYRDAQTPSVKISYIDPLGRNHQSISEEENGNFVYSGHAEYDNWNRVIKQYKPIVGTNGFTPLLPGLGDLHKSIEYEENVLSRVIITAPIGVPLTSNHTATGAYSIIPLSTLCSELNIGYVELNEMGIDNKISTIAANPAINVSLSGMFSGLQNFLNIFAQYLHWVAYNDYVFYKTQSTDENGNVKISYTYGNGRVFATKNVISVNQFAITMYQYDQFGNVIKIMNPGRQLSHFKYNGMGWQYFKQTPDAGKVYSMFDISGNKIMEQDANAISGHDNTGPYVRVWMYDQLGRPRKQYRARFKYNRAFLEDLVGDNPTKYLPTPIADIPLPIDEDPIHEMKTVLSGQTQVDYSWLDNYHAYGNIPVYDVLRPDINTCTDDNCISWSPNETYYTTEVPGVYETTDPLVVLDRTFWNWERDQVGETPWNWPPPLYEPPLGTPSSPDNFDQNTEFIRTSYGFNIRKSSNPNQALSSPNSLLDMTSIIMEKEWIHDVPPSINANIPPTKWCGNCNYIANVDAPIATAMGASTNAWGKLVFTASYNHEGLPVNYVFYNFDGFGNLSHETHQFNENGINPSNKGISSQIKYSGYNYLGQAEKVEIINIHNGKSATITNTYDMNGRLTKTTNNLASTPETYYTYNYATGRLINKNNGLTGQTLYNYDDRERLTNETNLYFTQDLYYDANHPQVNGAPGYVQASQNYNGNINAVVFKYTFGNQIIPYFQGPAVTYGYTYDGMQRLIKADALTEEDNITPITETYGDEEYTYDLLGNMLTKTSTPFEFGTGLVNTTYTNYIYRDKTNILTSTQTSIAGATPTLKTMLADPNGNIMQTHNQQGAKTLYGRSNMPFHVQTSSSEYIHYLYSVTDQRIYVETQNNTAGGIPAQANSGEYYLINAAGNVVSVYNKANVNDATFYFYGADGRIGHYDTHLAKTTAYVKDYLGNTRIALTSADPANPVENVYDYLPYGDILKTHQTGQTSEKYLSTEHERDPSTGLDYRLARYSDPIVGRFLSVDPKAAKFPSWSPYSFSFNNPIYFIDPDGQEPTPAEAARMAAHVYGDKKDNILTGGWRVSQRDFGVQLQDATGLKSLIYERVVDGKVKEYTYATAGTENLQDWIENGKQPLGLSEQYESSAKNAKKISGDLGETELSYVGHSLGGGEAALNSLLTDGDGVGRKAFTFNAAGVGDITKFGEGTWKTLFKSESNIEAYILSSDPLNRLQNSSPIMPDVNGNRHYLKPTDASSIYNGHSIDNIIKNFGVNPNEFKK